MASGSADSGRLVRGARGSLGTIVAQAVEELSPLWAEEAVVGMSRQTEVR